MFVQIFVALLGGSKRYRRYHRGERRKNGETTTVRHDRIIAHNLVITYLLTTQLLTSQNLEPVTNQAPKTQPFSMFRNSQLMVNPCLGS